jgi:hypothetical protein
LQVAVTADGLLNNGSRPLKNDYPVLRGNELVRIMGFSRPDGVHGVCGKYPNAEYH